jgi:hypothetical protein
MLERGNEGELDGLALLVAGVGAREAVLQSQRVVGGTARATPIRLTARRDHRGDRRGASSIGSTRFGRRSIVLRQALVAIL